MNVADPFELVSELIPDGNVVYLSHNDFRADYGDQSIFRMAYLMLSCKFKKVITDGNAKSVEIGYGRPAVDIDREYLHSLFDLEEIPESGSFEFFRELVSSRLSNLPEVDFYVGRGGGYLFDSFDWISLHRFASMLYYIERGTPVGLLPSTIYYNNPKLLKIFVEIAKKCVFVMAREPATYNWLKNICGLNNVHLVWDLTFLETPRQSPKEGKIGVILTTDKVQTKDFENFLERNPTLLFFSSSPKKDERRLRFSSVETGGEYRYVLGVDHLLETISACSAVVSDRFYGTAFSILEGVPVVPLKDRLGKSVTGLMEMTKFFKPLVPLEARLQ